MCFFDSNFDGFSINSCILVYDTSGQFTYQQFSTERLKISKQSLSVYCHAPLSTGVPYIAFYPGSLNGPLSVTLPSSIASVPVFGSQLSDHMSLWGRAQNLFYSFMAPIGRSFSNMEDHRLTSSPGLFTSLEILNISSQRSESRVVDIFGGCSTPPRVSPWWSGRST